jgi:hypothetical protein
MEVAALVTACAHSVEPKLMDALILRRLGGDP